MIFPSFLSLMTSSVERKLTREEILLLLVTFTTAGQATSFIVACSVYNFAAHMHWQKICRSELENEDANANDALEVLNTFPILDRVMKKNPPT